MRALVQRVSRARVRIRGPGSAAGSDLTAHPGLAEIERGVVVLVGVGRGDSIECARRLAQKITGLRIFGDESGRMNRSLVEVRGEVLAVSQFTLYADIRKGNRPSFGDAAPPELARELFGELVATLVDSGGRIEVGVFGADMEIELVNDGPVTVWLDTAQLGMPGAGAMTRSTR